MKIAYGLGLNVAFWALIGMTALGPDPDMGRIVGVLVIEVVGALCGSLLVYEVLK